jgi:ubiquinol-cytochrome c reductase subunit 7
MKPISNWYCNAAGYRALGLRYDSPLGYRAGAKDFDGQLSALGKMMGYGLTSGNRADDLIPEESEEVLLALKRLPQQEAYDRVFRLRRAFQASLAHQLLPKAQQTKPEEVRT